MAITAMPMQRAKTWTVTSLVLAALGTLAMACLARLLACCPSWKIKKLAVMD
jgi:hypothetical protein